MQSFSTMWGCLVAYKYFSNLLPPSYFVSRGECKGSFGAEHSALPMLRAYLLLSTTRDNKGKEQGWRPPSRPLAVVIDFHAGTGQPRAYVLNWKHAAGTARCTYISMRASARHYMPSRKMGCKKQRGEYQWQGCGLRAASLDNTVRSTLLS